MEAQDDDEESPKREAPVRLELPQAHARSPKFERCDSAETIVSTRRTRMLSRARRGNAGTCMTSESCHSADTCDGA